MKNNIAIHIPQPCHEDWQQMTPVDQGRFCQSCAKQVVDFSLMTDQQVLNYLSTTAGRVCGRFAEDQLQRPLQPTKQEKKKIWWVAAAMPLLMMFGKVAAQKKIGRKNTCGSIIKLDQASMSLGIVVFESSQTAQDNDVDTTNDKPTANNAPYFNPTITVWKKKDQDFFTIKGKIEEAKSNQPIPYATIILKGTKTATAADGNGNFKLAANVKTNQLMLSISAVGYLEAEVNVTVKDNEETKATPTFSIRGRVVDKSGNGIPYASITTKNSKQSLASDSEGRFSLSLPAAHPKDILTISSVGFEERQLPISKKDSGEIIIQCSAATQGLTEVVAGFVSYCRKPKKIDTLQTTIRKVFHTEPFKIYPNPAQRGQSITIDTKKQGEYSIQLFNNSGKLLQVKEFDATEGATQTPFTMPASAAAGIYYIRLVDEKTKKQYTDKVVVM